MTYVKVFLISLGFFLTTTFTNNVLASETTQNAETVSFAQGASVLFNDNTCSSHDRYQSLCCYHNIRYNCNYLREQFLAGYCRPDANNTRKTSWARCAAVPDAPAEAPASTHQTRTPARLAYAADLTNCAGTGEAAALRYGRSRGARSGAGYCAVGVRSALSCMFQRQGRPRTVHCGGAAYNYYGEGCLESMGFHSDMSMCNTPGVVRVYYGYKNRNSHYSGGDRYGHIEFLGTDRYWHAGVASSQPIDHPQKAGNRRILKACYVLGGA